MSLLIEIQNAAADGSVDLATLLRKCRLLAGRLNNASLEEWVAYEMDGYPKEAEVPEYRRVALNFKGTFSGPFNSGMKNAPVPQYLVAKHSGKKDIATYFCKGSIASLEKLTVNRNGDGETLTINMDNLILVMQGHIYEGMALNAFWAELPRGAIVEIINVVRNRVLELAIRLWKEYPQAGEIGGSNEVAAEADKRMTQIINNTVYGSASIVGNATSSTFNALTVSAGDFEAVRTALLGGGLAETDVVELEEAIQSDPTPANAEEGYGPKVKAWIGKSINKALDGTWKVGVAAAGKLTEEVLMRYYGFK